MSFDVHDLRQRFPAIRGSNALFFDGPAGTQVPDSVIEAVSRGLAQAASNVGGAFEASRRSGEVVDAARLAAADLLGGSPDEIVFGPNMTTITMAFTRAVLSGYEPGDRIVLSGIDHDANVTSWARAAADFGIEVDWIELADEHVQLDLDSLERVIGDRTRLVAIAGASNAFGTITDLKRTVQIAGRHGARVFVDAVHLAPHERIDASALGVDAVVCSGYKFYGPHVGVLWAKREWLDEVHPYKVRPAPAEAPGKFETGTPSFALLAGLTAAIDHLASLGQGVTRRERLDVAFADIRSYEASLGRRFLSGLPDNVNVWGMPSMEGRVPTFAVSVADRSPSAVARALAEREICVWSGHYYAVEPMRRLGLLDSGGLTRIGFVNTTTDSEIDRLIEALADL
ncbi:MAG: cysteine desulfurase-like protein [Acidimicrobiia bacterium]|nr:cysteine desulfurase-like protein [Acidimicrobiia bacterium]